MEIDKPIAENKDENPTVLTEDNLSSDTDKGYKIVYQKPEKKKARWLSFEYILAMAAAVLASLLVVDIVIALFGGWSGTDAALQSYIGGWAAYLLSLEMVTTSTGLISASVMSVLLGVVALVFFGRVSRKVPDRSGYTSRTVYKVVTYGSFGVLLVAALVLVAKLIGILLSSLVLIGVSDAASVYASLYVAEFVPYLLGLGLISTMLLMMRDIIQGKNRSRLMSIIVLSVASGALLASVVTVAVQVHTSGAFEKSQHQESDGYYGPSYFDFSS